MISGKDKDSKQRLPQELWEQIQQSVPIACVDMVLYRMLQGAPELGLIRRTTPDQGQRWCIIGGRLLLDESVAEAVHRELAEAFKGKLSLATDKLPTPIVVEFFRDRRPGHTYDLRQHALSLTHVIKVDSGPEEVQGDEAKAFKWFSRDELTSPEAAEVLGFGQEHLMPRIFAEIEKQNSTVIEPNVNEQ